MGETGGRFEKNTSEDFLKFDSSEHDRDAVKYIASYIGGNPPLTKSSYTCVWDYLIACLCMENASRTGAIANMTCVDVNQAKKSEDTILITVVNHKTTETAGPAILCLPVLTFTHLDIFISKMRSQIQQKAACNTTFLTWTGQEMSTSQVSEQINSFWEREL